MTRTKSRPAAPTARQAIRCAIYTRKSTEEGLEQEFNSLDAQRESGEAYIKSQTHEGWECLPCHYDDGGFTGGNMERPALRRLMADIDAGKIDCVVVYKVDRLSRSLLDFARMMETFDKHRVSFVSVTQQFNTATSMGRLVLNVLLSFAQFEREIISERTRDKIAAARRKGKWAGGHPILGYDVDPQGFKLIVNEEEAARVRAIFDLYLASDGLLQVVAELERRGWRNKEWTTRKGTQRGGRPFDKNSLWHLLTNVAYCGKVRYKHEIHDGEHTAIVDAETWQRVQVKLQRNGRTGGALVRNKFGAVLKGLLHCVPCGCAMTPTHSTRNGTKRYRYYVCSNAQKRGWHTCPSKSIPAGEVERFVVERIAGIGRDPALVADTVRDTSRLVTEQLGELAAEQRRLQREVGGHHEELRKLVHNRSGVETDGLFSARLADLQERIAAAERRLAQIEDERKRLEGECISETDVARALADFESIWGTLTPREQTNMLHLLIERIDYDGRDGTIAIAFHATGIKTLSTRDQTEEVA
jgi:site-specific DNA recombinase